MDASRRNRETLDRPKVKLRVSMIADEQARRSALALRGGIALALALVLGCEAELSNPGAANAGAAGSATAGNAATSGASGSSGASTGGAGNSTGTGGAGGTTGGASGTGGVPTCTDIDADETAAGVLRRLTKLEYALTLQDLFALIER